MNVRFNSEQESELHRLASARGTAVEDVVVDLVAGALRTEEFYRVKLERSIAQADRGEFIDEEEMDRRFAAMLKHG